MIMNVVYMNAAQITQWDLIFYGTEVPPQPDDSPRRLGSEKHNLDSEVYDGEYGHNVLEFEPGIAGQWKDIQQVRYRKCTVLIFLK